MALTVKDVLECSACRAELRRPGLMYACATVGIEHGKTARDVLLGYLATYHRGGHKREWRKKEDAPASSTGAPEGA